MEILEALERNRAWRVFRHAKAVGDILSYFGLLGWIVSGAALAGGVIVTWIAVLPIWGKLLVGLSTILLILLSAMVVSVLRAQRSPQEDSEEAPPDKSGRVINIASGPAIMAALILAAVMSTKPHTVTPLGPNQPAPQQPLPVATAAPKPTASPVPTISPPQAAQKKATPAVAPPQIGNDNTLVNVAPPQSVGNGNTIIGPADANRNTIYNRGGTAIGRGATASPTGVAIGSGANAGSLPSVVQNNSQGINIGPGAVVSSPQVNNQAKAIISVGAGQSGTVTNTAISTGGVAAFMATDGGKMTVNDSIGIVTVPGQGSTPHRFSHREEIIRPSSDVDKSTLVKIHIEPDVATSGIAILFSPEKAEAIHLFDWTLTRNVVKTPVIQFTRIRQGQVLAENGLGVRFITPAIITPKDEVVVSATFPDGISIVDIYSLVFIKQPMP